MNKLDEEVDRGPETVVARTISSSKYRLLFCAAQGATMLGSQIAVTAIPLLALSLAGASTFDIGVLTALATVPNLLVSMFVGSAIDAYSVRWFALVPALLRIAVLVAAVAALTLSPTLAVFAMIALLLGTLSAATTISVAPSVAVLFEADGIRRLMIELGRTRSIAQIAGLAFAGALVSLLAAKSLLLDAGMCLIAFAALWVLFGAGRGSTPVARLAAADRPSKNLLRSGRDGFKYCIKHQELRALMLTSAAWNFGQAIVSTLLYPYFVRDQHLAAFQVSLFFASVSCGAFAASFAVARLSARMHNGRLLVATLSMLAGSWCVVAMFPSGSHVPLLVLGAFVGSLMALFSTLTATRQQIVVEKLYQGRTAAVSNISTYVLVPVGALAAGWLGSVYGLRLGMLCGVLPMVIGVLVLANSSVSRVRTMSSLDQAALHAS